LLNGSRNARAEVGTANSLASPVTAIEPAWRSTYR
jgi:hypothetical protein